MTISRATGSSGLSSATVTVNPGDLVVLFSVRDGSTVPGAFAGAGLTIPAGVSGNFGGTGGESTRLTTVVIPSTFAAGTSVTFTSSSAAFVAADVYRTDLVGGAMSAGTPATGGATSASITIPALTLAPPAGGSSWVYAAVATAGSITVEPTGLTRRESSSPQFEVFDTAAAVTSWAAHTMSTATSRAYRSHSLEIRETPAAGPSLVYRGSRTGSSVYLGSRTEAQLYIGANDLFSDLP